MPQVLAAFSRYRPRALTLLPLGAIAALIVLANLSEEFHPRTNDLSQVRRPPAESDLQFDLGEPAKYWTHGLNISYGWPLLWRQYVVLGMIVGENYSAGRLAANLAIWLVLLVAPAALCEWLLRRYRPRLRFGLRTMLAAVGLTAAFCAWFATARNRAAVQDPIITASLDPFYDRFWVERWGPKWLEAVDADRFCRRIVGAELEEDRFRPPIPASAASDESAGDEEDDREAERIVEILRSLPDLQYLSLYVHRLSPDMIEALGKRPRLVALRINVGELVHSSNRALGGALAGMRRLRALNIGPTGHVDIDDEDGIWEECLAGIGVLDRLEHLRLEERAISCAGLSRLAGLTNLKSLTLDRIFGDDGTLDADPPLLSCLPALPNLESLNLEDSGVSDHDLRYVAALPRLKLLNLWQTEITGAGLAELAPSDSLEELAIGSHLASAAAFESLLRLKRLKKLHIVGFDQDGDLRDRFKHLSASEIDDCIRTLEALRASKPDLVIDDSDVEAFKWPDRGEGPKAEWIPPECESNYPREFRATLPYLLLDWKEKQAAKQANQSPASPSPAN